MEAYKRAIGDTEEVMKHSRQFISENGGKQKYKFEEDKTKNNPRCQLCEKTTYPAERTTFNSVPYHKNCFRCIFCISKISGAQATPISNVAFSCQNHKEKVLMKSKPIKKKPQKSQTTATQKSREPIDFEKGIDWRVSGKKQNYLYREDLVGDKKRIDPRCQKCGRTVYPAEKFCYEAVPYHRSCVRCLECKKILSPNDATPFGNDVFLCNNHFGKLTGAIALKARANTGASTTSSAFQKADDLQPGMDWVKSGKKQVYKYPEDARVLNPRCNLCGKTSYKAETLTYNGIPYHTACFRCLRCGKKLNAGDANPFGDQNYLCNNHFQNVIPNLGLTQTTSKRPVEESGPKFEKDEHGLDPRMYVGYQWRVDKGKQTYKYPEDLNVRGKVPRCNYCGKKSYPAETMTYESVPYHLKCVRCLKCAKKLSSGNATPFGEDVFLCNSHFDQYGQGAGLPVKGEIASSGKKVEVEKEVDEMQNLSKLERRKLRRKLLARGK